MVFSAVALGAVAGTVAVAPGSAGGRLTSAVRQLSLSAAASKCPDVLLVGARGSGEKGPGTEGWKPPGTGDTYGLGGPVESVYQRLKAGLGSHRTIQVLSVSYAANGVQTLTHAPRQYFSNIAAGVSWTLRQLTAQAKSCPDQQIVLAGFSQGAMVLHRVVHSLGGSKAGRQILARMAAAVLVGDGDELPNDYQTRYGTASTNARGIAQSLRTISHASTARFSSALTARVLSVCNNHDLVCGWTDFNLACLSKPASCLVPLAAMIKIHLSYTKSKPTLATADRAATLVRELPAPRPVTVSATAGTGLRYELKADVAAGFTLQWRLASSSKLPSNLSLSGSGLVTGTPAIPGTHAATVQVRSIRNKLASPWLPVTVTFAVAAERGGWTSLDAPLPGDAASQPVASVTDISCPSPSFCAGVGNYDTTVGHDEGFLLTWSGTSWSAVRAPLPAGGIDSRLSAVSCPSTSFCMAVGTYDDTAESAQGLMLTWSGRSWSAAKETLPADPGNPGLNLADLSCASSSFCVAVGNSGGSRSYRLLWTWSGASWAVSEAPTPAGGQPSGFLYGVSCASATFCVAVGDDGPQSLILSWSGDSWSAVNASLPADTASPPASFLNGVSCPSTMFCTAVGMYEDSSGRTQGLVLTLSGGSWSPDRTPLPADSNSQTQGTAYGVSCPSASFCAAAGNYVNTTWEFEGLLLTRSGGTWSATAAPQDPRGEPSVLLSRVSCPTASFCVASGWANGGSPDQEGVLATRSQ